VTTPSEPGPTEAVAAVPPPETIAAAPVAMARTEDTTPPAPVGDDTPAEAEVEVLPFGKDVPRVETECSMCGQVDDHPKHNTYYTGKHPITGKPVDLSVLMHFDCCSGTDAGCHDGSCNVILDHAGDKRGQELIDHIHDNVDDLEPLHEENRQANLAAAAAAKEAADAEAAAQAGE
jgi:hypothetical protein